MAFRGILIHSLEITVSFFGDSHVAMPLQEAKLSTNLRLRFRTRQDNGILFLAAGRTDYCLLSIDDGRVKLNLKINEHFTEVCDWFEQIKSSSSILFTIAYV